MNQTEYTIGGHIFAAGLGTRLAPITNITPKPLVKVKNIPLLAYQISFLTPITKLNPISVNIFHLAEQFNGLVFPNFVKLYTEPHLYGHAATLSMMSKFHNEDVIIAINSDTIFQLDPNSLLPYLDKFMKEKNPLRLGICIRREIHGPLGISRNNKIVGAYRKDGSFMKYLPQDNSTVSEYADAVGIYFITRELYTKANEILKNQSFAGFFGKDDLVQLLLEQGGECVLSEIQHLKTLEVTTPDDLLALNKKRFKLPYAINR